LDEPIDDESESWEVKLVDFNLSMFFNPNEEILSDAGTEIYMAPEIFKGGYNEKVDIWSIGIITFEMLTGDVPFSSLGGRDIDYKYDTELDVLGYDLPYVKEDLIKNI